MNQNHTNTTTNTNTANASATSSEILSNGKGSNGNANQNRELLECIEAKLDIVLANQARLEQLLVGTGTIGNEGSGRANSLAASLNAQA